MEDLVKSDDEGQTTLNRVQEDDYDFYDGAGGGLILEQNESQYYRPKMTTNGRDDYSIYE